MKNRIHYKERLAVLFSDIPAGDGKIANLFLQCKYVHKWNGKDNKRSLKMTALINAEYWKRMTTASENDDQNSDTEWECKRHWHFLFAKKPSFLDFLNSQIFILEQ